MELQAYPLLLLSMLTFIHRGNGNICSKNVLFTSENVELYNKVRSGKMEFNDLFLNIFEVYYISVLSKCVI